MRRNVVLSTTTLVVSLLFGASAGLGSADVSVTAWSAPVTLVPLRVKTFSPVVDVNASGAFAAAWYAGEIVPPHHHHRRRNQSASR